MSDAHESAAAPAPVPGPPSGMPPIPKQPALPPRPDGAPFLAWLRAPRPDVPVGIWRLGHRPRPETEPESVPGRQLIGGALLAALMAWFAWSLLYNGYLGRWWLLPLILITPDSWRYGQAGPVVTVLVYYGYYALIIGGLLFAAGKLGRWADVWRRYGAPRAGRERAGAPVVVPEPGEDPARWPQLRAVAPAAADRLTAEALAGLMRDVDHARITRAWQAVRSGRRSPEKFTQAVVTAGARSCAHPSGARDLPVRTAHHDLLTGQVRVGTAADHPKNPNTYRQAGIALDPALLGTSVLALGPSGSGKTRRVLRPLAEAMCMQALTGQAAVVVVGAAGADLGPAGAYDVIVRLGHPDSVHDLDLYGGSGDPDEAAAILAEALAGDLEGDGVTHRAGVVLSRLLAPHHALYGRFPSVPELRHLLDAGAPLETLRADLVAAGHDQMVRDLDAARRHLVPGGLGEVLADRVALLDRPAFARFFDPTGDRVFSLRALDHPVRVRIELPDRGHIAAGLILSRLILAQFTAFAAARTDRSLFACLVLDSAGGVITPDAVRGIQQLRSAHAGLVLALRTLEDVPPSQRTPLLGAMGCRIALAGITPWDGQLLAEAWGTEWIETTDVTDRQIIAESAGGRAWHAVRRAITGKYVTARAVTVRQVERQRWSASELAHAVPPGHAVLSLSSVEGERTSPLLVDLRT
ncbi:hypothetical protein EES46_34625 [Streptomyces sp. ADI98-10]|nr:hypothetical protein EES46_34625 [Streptomyces sp. ADI98-10]